MTIDGIADVVVRAVATAEEAVRQLATGDICAVVTDLGLPKMSGFDLIEFLRSEVSFAKLPVLVVSGETGEEARTRALARISHQ
jgi:DNA-binding response OmpR family regulator